MTCDSNELNVLLLAVTCYTAYEKLDGGFWLGVLSVNSDAARCLTVSIGVGTLNS
jgi:hypothetical protein